VSDDEAVEPRNAESSGRMPVGGDLTAGLGDKTLSGVKWMSAARLVGESSVFASIVVLAHLVAPDEVGRTAVAVFLGVLAQAVAQLGTGAFLVSHKTPAREHFEAAAWASLVAGSLGSILVLAFALTLGPIVFGERTASLVALSSPVWLFAGLTAVPYARLQRDLAFARLGVVQASASVAGAVTAVVLAVVGLEGEAIVLGAVATAAVMAGTASLFARPPRPRRHTVEVREILQYSGPASGSSIVFAGTRNVDYVLLAAFIPPFQVGLYMRAFALGSDYQSKISQILLNVAFPVLSRATSREQIHSLRARMIRVHTLVLFPLLFGLIALAPEFVPWLFGERWSGAAELTQILAVSGMISALGTGTGPLLMATGHTQALLAYNLIGLTVFTLAVLAAVPFGVVAVCYAVVGIRFVSFVVLQRVIVERRVGVPILKPARDDVVVALVCGAPQLAVTAVALHLALDASLPVFVAMTLSGAVGLAVYVAILRLFFRSTWSDLTTLFRRLAPLESVRLLPSRLATGVRSRGRVSRSRARG
jgi:O-antigen/teichoic acid export membrane protein